MRATKEQTVVRRACGFPRGVRRFLLVLFASGLFSCGLLTDAHAVLITAASQVTLPPPAGAGANYDPDQIVDWTGTDASLFEAVNFVAGNEDIDAIASRSNGNLLLSTAGVAVIGSLTFRSGDLVEYDPIANAATLFLIGNTLTTGTDAFGNTTSVFRTAGGAPATANIDAIHERPDGTLLLSTAGTNRIGAGIVQFDDEDIVFYNPTLDAASILLDFSTYDFALDIVAVSERFNGLLVMSRGPDNPTTIGGVLVGRSDLFEFNHSAGTIDGLASGAARLHAQNPASFFLPASATPNINGVDLGNTTPEPSSLGLLSLAILSLSLLRRRRR